MTEWAVAVTTAPRKRPTIRKCLESISACGWKPIVFAEPDSLVPIGTIGFLNEIKLGVWHNWIQSVRWVLDNTDASIIMTVQDDSYFHPDSKTYIEQALWPSPNIGFVSLYTPKHYTVRSWNGSHRPVGINRILTSSMWGACATIFPRIVLEKVITHPTALKWQGVLPGKNRKPGNKEKRLRIAERRRLDPSLVANSDTAIGKIINVLNREMWFVDPSPVSHIATHSTIAHGGNKGRRNCFRCSDHTIPLKDQCPLPSTLFNVDGNLLNANVAPGYAEGVKRWFKLGHQLTMSVPLKFWTLICDAIKPGMRTLEFGCGVSTTAFGQNKNHNHIAIEQSAKQAKEFKCAVYSPLNVDGWYSVIPEGGKFDVILVDGPFHGDRLRFLEVHTKLVKSGTILFIDDAERHDGECLVGELEDLYNVKAVFHADNGRMLAQLDIP